MVHCGNFPVLSPMTLNSLFDLKHSLPSLNKIHSLLLSKGNLVYLKKMYHISQINQEKSVKKIQNCQFFHIFNVFLMFGRKMPCILPSSKEHRENMKLLQDILH